MDPNKGPTGMDESHEARFHRAIKGILSKKEQGKIMGAFRESAPPPPRVCGTCHGTGVVKNLHNWATGGKREQACWACYKPVAEAGPKTGEENGNPR